MLAWKRYGRSASAVIVFLLPGAGKLFDVQHTSVGIAKSGDALRGSG